MPSAPWRGTSECHAAPGWAAAAGDVAVCIGTALGCSLPAQPTQPAEPPPEPPHNPGEKNRRKISLTNSWVWKRAGASHAEHTNPPCGHGPRVAGNSTQCMVNAFNNYSLQLIWEGGWLSHEERPRDLVCVVGGTLAQGERGRALHQPASPAWGGHLLKWC